MLPLLIKSKSLELLIYFRPQQMYKFADYLVSPVSVFTPQTG